MSVSIHGIHHISAICGDPQENLDFYIGLLGLRLVKRTVNYDDPGMYHLYYGDTEGAPGTLLTFFPIPGAPRGRRGTGEVSTTALAIPAESLGYWTERLVAHGVSFDLPAKRFGETVLGFADPSGLPLELVATSDGRPGWQSGPVPPEHAIRGIHSATLAVQAYEPTHAVLTEGLGCRLLGQEGERYRYAMGSAEPGALVDVLYQPQQGRHGIGSLGSVHHIAWRVADEAALEGSRSQLAGRGLYPTPIRERNYFRSVYFREPGGVLFELATDPPGFTIDETVAELGMHLKLPAWLEPERRMLEENLAPLRLPE